MYACIATLQCWNKWNLETKETFGTYNYNYIKTPRLRTYLVAWEPRELS